MAETRKLAAILAADVAGYSKLAGADEERTLARLRALRSDLFDPTIALHHGRVVKRTGDGVLIEFRSVVDAVRCAIEVQNGMVERNAGLQPERRIELRVGIHLGDVVEESDGDLMGDGVNIASRLEGIAKPGTICLSEDAYRQVKSRLDLAVSDLGATQLKNIAEPVRVYSVEVGKPAHPQPVKPASVKPVKAAQRNLLVPIIAATVLLIIVAGVGALYFAGGPKSVAPNAPQPTAASMPAELTKQATPEPPKAPERLSIVVLPFTNLSGDPSQDYLADVITEVLTSSLSRIAGSFVIARNTAFTYKGKPIDVRQVGRDLGVRYALEGSAQLSGSRVRVTAQLIDAESGAHLWSDQFDGQRADLLEMQDEIVRRLSRPLEIRLIDVDAARVARIPPGNLDAQDLALQCMAGIITSPVMGSEYNPALGFCERALEIDNRNAIALTFMAYKYIGPVIGVESTDPQAATRHADELVSRALVIDRNFDWAHNFKALVLTAQKRNEEAIVEAEQILALNPSFILVYDLLCEANNFLGRPERCIEDADKAIRLSPRDPLLWVFYADKAWALLMQQQDDQAIEWVRRSLAIAPDTSVQQLLLTSALALTGRQAEAREALGRYLSLKGSSKTIAQLRPQHRALSDNPKWLAYSDRLMDGLRRAGMPEE
jgi:adenylate cyclase